MKTTTPGEHCSPLQHREEREVTNPIVTIQTRNNLYTPIIAEGITLESTRAGTPGKLSFHVTKDEIIGQRGFHEGDQVRLSLGGEILFAGFVFTKRRSYGGIITVTAYDQIRYLKNRDTYAYEDITVSTLLHRIAKDWGMQTGEIEETGYILPPRIENGRALLDMLQTAIDITHEQTGHPFVLYDKAGRLCLTHAKNMRLDTLVHAGSIGNFDYSSTIDRDAYSAVRLHRTDPAGGETIFYEERREDLHRRWGMLCHYARLTEDTDGRVSARALMQKLGRKTRRLRIFDAVGDPRVRGGAMLPVELYVGDLNLGKFFHVERVIHRFAESSHLMELNLTGGDFVD